ncbi:MAG: alpha-amylase family glycosyl hydrolase [Anaerolineales bacterium]|nr:alpha-amylase family glycosyl hydrolase [Anaerolineales bacterium]MCX7754287.1 alpha-amylase family glycosyl hydrolase [Anaerolineales bacterium]MDW8278678.1 alpha-amylase family glycosyl hydrolase [Anaerolineales bacterium]
MKSCLPFEFHVSRWARDTYRFEAGLFATDGRVVLADFSAARRFAAQMTAVRGAPVPASHVYAMGLIDEILHILIRQYELQNPGVMQRALSQARERMGAHAFEQAQLRFLETFPPVAVYQNQMTEADYLNGETAGRPHRQTTLEEMLILNVTNQNPAVLPYKELFDDEPLRRGTVYEALVQGLADFLNAEPAFGGSGAGETLIEALRAPARVAPYSLEGQLQFLLERWGALLGEAFIQRILRAMDFVKEDAIRGNFAGGFAGSAPVPQFGGAYAEYERFSPDRDWMPRCVLIAKNTYVWLEQLSRWYQRDIHTLDAIPDEELDKLAARGITGLWLIGLWERSRASQRIKQRMGDHDAVASAYSLYSYDIAADLGGWPALENLRWRAWQRGIRLSADMVPNHMGIDSKWVIEHPDWFLSLPYPPYPGYTFESENLCDDERVAVILEDHYYSRSDAAVVFKRIDRWTGDVRYIYHGNDGTSMPWNDTAQLNYLKPEVREAVIQTILHVARNFPIIRFDAAMTLAKKHIQRLWFPEPGSGGAIPSRAEHGMTRAEFDALMPQEFWREVVDRVAAEVPDTLLLAEAFWLMEGYFVRTLGMHRVYNSAFMHMMRDEDNAKYRQVMKNTLEFDPQIMKRYVNFMNNPDEKTAIEQFGDGDKYFGVATMMSTLPGLPMFGHGQFEGFREKYGMEFRRPKWDEWPNEGLIRGHEWRIFPLLHKRYLFAEVENFLLYDFFVEGGYVNEDVFAHSNRFGEERGLVVYHNKYAHTAGWVKTSVGYMDKASGQIVQRTLAEGLNLPKDGYAIFRDYVTHLEYIRSCAEMWEKGMFFILGAYQCHAFLDWRFVSGEKWQKVYEALNGAGVESLQARFDEMFPPVQETPRVEKKKRATRKKTQESISSEKKPTVRRARTSKRGKAGDESAPSDML